jgi:hypothetical protein
MSMLPTLEAITYCAMYAFRSHLHVSSGEKHLTTRDSAMFTHYGDFIWTSQMAVFPIFPKYKKIKIIKSNLHIPALQG